MKKKWFDILLIGAGLQLLFCFFSCSEEIVIDPGMTGGGSVDTQGAYLSVSLATNAEEPSASVTRAVSYTEGTAAENKIFSVYLVLYDQATEVVKYQIPLEAYNGDGTANFSGKDVLASSDAVTFQTQAQKIEKDNYDLLVLVNPQQYIINITRVGWRKQDFEIAKRLNISQLATGFGSGTDPGKEYTHIFMSNSLGYIKIDKDTHIFNTADDAVRTGNILRVGVDRAVAKVLLDISPNLTIYPAGSGARFENVKWQLDNVNKKAFLMRQVAPMLNYEPESSIDPADDYKTYRYKLYATDPNWDNFSYDRLLESGSTSFPNLFEDFYQIRIEHPDGAYAEPALSLPANKFQYVLENTMAADEQWEDVTTRILIKANYIPSGFSANTDYYYYDNKGYTLSDLITMRNMGIWDSQGLRNTVEQAIAEGFFTNVTAYGLGNPVNSKSTADGFLRYYKGGMSYYYILIRHFPDSEVPQRMGYGRYGIVRNNIYSVSITSVNGPGSPDIPQPKGPDDKEYTYLSSRINVLPWTVRSQSNVIKHPYPSQ